MKYVIYLRASTDKQEHSTAAQRVAIHTFLNNRGEYASVEFIDEAISSGIALHDRDALIDAIGSIKKGDIFIVDIRDRMGRDVYELCCIEREIKKRGGTIIAASQYYDGLNEGTRQLFNTILDAFAQFERFMIKLRIKKGLKQAKERGRIIGNLPFGTKAIAGEDLNKRGTAIHVVVPSDIERAALDKMIQLYEDGYTYRQIADILNANQLYNRASKPWIFTGVHKKITAYLKSKSGCLIPA